MINERLDAILKRISNPTLFKASHYALFPGGKRIRPKMVLSISGKKGIDIACAIELIHTYTLIHDDLPAMDNDDYRRGKLSLHKAFDEATAILTGDLLLTLAFEVISDAKLPKKLIVKTIQTVSKLIGANGLIVGQHLDISHNSETPITNLSEKIALRKTADLFKASLISGALVANVSEEEISIYSQFGEAFGLLYQLKDDLDDKNHSLKEDEIKKMTSLLYIHAEHLLSRLSKPNSFLFSSLSTIAVTEMSDQTLSAVSHMSKNA